MKDRRGNQAVSALSDFVVEVCVAGGFTLGLLAGLQGHPREVSAPPATRASAGR